MIVPDIVLVNAKVVTVDCDFSIAEAVAIRGDRIVAVGRSEDVRRLAGKATRVLDAGGRTVLPGINDSHIHLALWGLSRPPYCLDVGFPAVQSVSDIQQQIAERALVVGPGDWIRGAGWDEGFIAELSGDPPRFPTRDALDIACPDNPVHLQHRSMHGAWVNTRALAIAGITRDTPDPAGGQIVRDPITGEPTGCLLETASRLVTRMMPEPTRAEQKDAIRAAMQELNAQGVTSATDPMVQPEFVSTYNELLNEGALTVRLGLLLFWSPMGQLSTSLEVLEQATRYVGMRTGFGNEWLRVAGCKIFADGAPPLKTAWMYEPYTGGGTGGLVVGGQTEDEQYDTLLRMIAFMHRQRFQVWVHAIGDRACDAVAEGFIRALKEDAWADARHIMIHAGFLSPETARRLAPYGIGVSTNSNIKWQVADLMQSIVDERRSAYHIPFKSLVDAGLHVADSSDAPVLHPNWKRGIQTLVLRESRGSGRVSGPEECITREQAIRAWTIEGAWQDKLEHLKGSIEVGKLADLVVLEEDILTIDPRRISQITTVMTIVGGKIVFDATEAGGEGVPAVRTLTDKHGSA